MNNYSHPKSLCKDKLLYNKWFDSIDDILEPVEFLKKGKILYANTASVFDIEASSFYKGDEKRACMYAWVFGINGKCIRGRTWEDFLNVINIVVKYYKTSSKKHFIVYVHNLAYEFQWFKHYFEWEKVFSVESRKPLYAITTSGIEFRCSYLLSGYSLAKVGENLTKYHIEKLVGDLDYQLIRHSATPLTDKEWGYILNDGLVVMAYINELIDQEGDITKLPLTNTGFVRNYCREKCFNGDDKFNYPKLMKCLTLTKEDYEQAKRVYSGGFTHANFRRVNKVWENVSSFDFTSSYPSVMLAEMYPMSKPYPYTPKSKDEFLNVVNTKCCMFDVVFYNIEAKVDFEHYISRSRCNVCEDYVLDNGRIVSASKLQLGVTEIDFDIICRMYKWEKMTVGNMVVMSKGYLPKPIIECVLDLYQDKTTLKGIDEKVAEYMHSKGMLNSCYGMSVTDPCKDEQVYSEGDGWYSEKADIELLIAEYNKNPQRFLYYLWGVWITAYARFNLFTGILEFKDDYIYSDTDSLKVLNADKHKKYIEAYNKQVTKKIDNCLKHYRIDKKRARPKTIKGVEKQIGVWDYEGTYSKFKTLGAKRYMYVEDGELHITIAGVNKKTGVKYLKWKYKTIDNIFKNFKDELVFPSEYIDEKGEVCNASGKLCHTYIDKYYNDTVIDYLGNEGVYMEASSVHMEPTSYELSMDAMFLKLIMGIQGSELINVRH